MYISSLLRLNIFSRQTAGHQPESSGKTPDHAKKRIFLMEV
jgi:hypothetical protein